MTPTMKPHFFLLAERIAVGMLRVWIVTGILLRVTNLRDRWHPLAVVFYSTPWPVMAAGFLILALHAARHRRRHVVRRYALLSGASIFVWFALSWYFTPVPPPLGPNPIRVITWNAGHPGARFGIVSKWLRAQNADILAIAEAQPEGGDILAQWRAAFPEYQVEPLPGEMLCLVRGELRLVEQGEVGPGSYYGLSHATVRGAQLTLLEADIDARPREPRQPPLHRLEDLARAHRQERLLVLGDFNTPRESTAFDTYREFLTHCFEATGSGLAETWPTWCPALSLDHVWASDSAHPVSTRIAWPLWSDHRPVIVDLAP